MGLNVCNKVYTKYKTVERRYLAINQYIMGIFAIRYFYWNYFFVYSN